MWSTAASLPALSTLRHKSESHDLEGLLLQARQHGRRSPSIRQRARSRRRRRLCLRTGRSSKDVPRNAPGSTPPALIYCNLSALCTALLSWKVLALLQAVQCSFLLAQHRRLPCPWPHGGCTCESNQCWSCRCKVMSSLLKLQGRRHSCNACSGH